MLQRAVRRQHPRRTKQHLASDGAWLAAMNAWRRVDQTGTIWTCGAASHGLGTGYTNYSQNWAGNVEAPSASGRWVNGTFNNVELTWSMPHPAPDYSGNPSGNTIVSVWPGLGIGSASNDELVQAGTETDLCSGSYTRGVFWYEIYAR
jgi:Peptidase A4 family